MPSLESSDREGRRSQCRKDHAHRNSGSICDKITSHRRPSDLLGQFTEEEKEDGEIQKFSYWTFTVLLGALLRCYKARVTSVEYNKVPEKAYVFTFAELGSF